MGALEALEHNAEHLAGIQGAANVRGPGRRRTRGTRRAGRLDARGRRRSASFARPHPDTNRRRQYASREPDRCTVAQPLPVGKPLTLAQPLAQPDPAVALCAARRHARRS